MNEETRPIENIVDLHEQAKLIKQARRCMKSGYVLYTAIDEEGATCCKLSNITESKFCPKLGEYEMFHFIKKDNVEHWERFRHCNVYSK